MARPLVLSRERTLTRESKKDISLRTAQLANLLAEVGPDIPEIARRLGQFKESVRYRYKEKILKKGIGIHALIDYDKLGLKRVIFLADVAPDYREYMPAILTAMNDLCYVTGFEKVIPEGLYTIAATVPAEFVKPLVDFFGKLKEIGLFASFESFDFDFWRNIPMRAEFYDFDTGRWEFDWSMAQSPNFEAASYVPSQKTKYDYVDLLILKELQTDGNRSLVEMAKNLKGINYKTLSWHYLNHVIHRSLIRGYTLRWMGSRYDYKIDRALHRKHKYLRVDLLVKNLTQNERIDLMSKLTRLPFLWAEAGGSSYFAQLAFPLDFVTEAMQFLEGVLAPFKTRARYLIMDQTSALGFTFSYQLYDPQAKTWKLNETELIPRFENLLLKIKEGTG
jgi:DNA-binding Lrp family transcriptional regulator